MNYGKQRLVLTFVLSGTFLFARNIYAQETAFFREVNGTVEIKVPGSTAWVNAAEGNRIEKNTLISTGFKSTAILVLGDSVIMVRPITRLSLEEIIRDQNNERVNLYLQTGRIRVDVKPPAGGETDFTVRSPIATASVRGTSFEFDTERLLVDEGRVQYSLVNGNKRETYVSAGETSYVDENNSTIVSPFEAVVELLVPALPVGSGSSGSVGEVSVSGSPAGGSGGPVGDSAPEILPPTGANAGVGFEWN